MILPLLNKDLFVLLQSACSVMRTKHTLLNGLWVCREIENASGRQTLPLLILGANCSLFPDGEQQFWASSTPLLSYI
jgi:hypothetical protein